MKNWLILTFLGLSSVFAQETRLPNDFVTRLNNEIYDEWEDAGTKLSASLFESLTDRELFKTQLLGELDVSLKVQRRVFDNQDILDTYTVVDILRIPFNLPIPLYSDEIGLGAGGFGLNMGLSFGGESFHIRQVEPESFDKIKSLAEIETDLNLARDEADDLYDEVTAPSANDWDYTLIDEGEADDTPLGGLNRLMVWRSQNPRVRARYHKLWNLITHPLGIPLSAKRMDDYPVGNVANYGVNGGVQLGLRAGWSEFEISGLNLTQGQASLGITTYLRGNFNITLWKESDQFAQVKVTRKLTDGINYNIGQSSFEHEIFEGFMVLDQNILKIKEQFIPFSFNVNQSFAKEFEVGYRYDLTNPKARKAYEAAVLGRFKDSYQLAQDKSSGVEERFVKESRTTSESENYRMKLSLIFEKSSGNVISNTKAKVQMDGKEHILHSSKSLVFNSYDTLWGANESRRHEFLTTLNRNTYEVNETEGMGMRIIGRIEDSHTDGKELHAYIDEVEAAISKPGTFPRPPVYLPQVDCSTFENQFERSYDNEACEEAGDSGRKKAKYGRTSFFYQVDLDLNHLIKIKEASKKEFWSAFEKAFKMKEGSWSQSHRRLFSLAINSPLTFLNLPLALINVNIDNGGRLVVAYRFYRQWKKLKKIEDPRELVKAFGELYDTVHYGTELVMATRILAGDAQANYIMNAKANDVWGTLNGSQGSMGDAFPINHEAQRRSQYDSIGPRINVDTNAVVNKIELTKVDNDTAKLTFDLKEKPQFLYLRVDRTSSWSRYQNLLKIIVSNSNGEITEGSNTILIRRSDTEGLGAKLRKAIFNGKQSHIMIAYSIKGQDFGSVASAKFRFEDE